MYHSLLKDAIFYNSLLALDRLIAEQVRQSGCLFCHGNLHQSHYPRKRRGVPEGTHSDYPIRFSYCCAQDGCRKRFTAPSMRFLSRKVYSSVIIFLVFLLKSKTDELKVEELNLLLGTSLSVETVRRWRNFWVKEVSQSHIWKRTAFSHVMAQTLPASLLNVFQQDLSTSLKKALQWILPLTAGVYLFDVPFRLVSRG
jgi:hypothetical protein